MTLVEKAQELVKALLLPLVETEVKKHQAEIDAKVDHIVDLVFAKLEEINPLKFANPIVEAEKPLVKAAVHAELLKLEDQISAKV